MKFKLEFDMDNAAFEDFKNGEVKNILESTKEKVDAGWTMGAVVDSNGNTVGQWSMI
jgi:hypothetical protein